jgi:hypothetical protein
LGHEGEDLKILMAKGLPKTCNCVTVISFVKYKTCISFDRNVFSGGV